MLRQSFFLIVFLATTTAFISKTQIVSSFTCESRLKCNTLNEFIAGESGHNELKMRATFQIRAPESAKTALFRAGMFECEKSP